MYLKFLWSLLCHKWFVFVECCKLGIPLLGVIHDWSKFLPSEFIPYARNFYGDYPNRDEIHGDMRNQIPGRYTKEGVKASFDVAWLHHQKRNRHHWQYWILQYDDNDEWTAGEMYNGAPISIYHNWQLACVEPEGSPLMRPAILDVFNALRRSPIVLPMPDRYRREMLADWIGAGRAYGKQTQNNNNPDTKRWYLDNKDKIILHPETRKWVEDQLCVSSFCESMKCKQNY